MSGPPDHAPLEGHDVVLPPGQHAIDHFPRFGAHGSAPPPPIPAQPTIRVTGAIREPLTIPLVALDELARREAVVDFHCVAGWSAVGLRWGGFGFGDFFRRFIDPVVGPDVVITHLVFSGLDGYRSIVTMADAMEEAVMLADRLNGAPLGGDHGAPLRLISPAQYGFISTKHLCEIALHTSAPRVRYHNSLRANAGLQLLAPHPRARVWLEERHRYLPAWVLRDLYRRLIPLFKAER